MVEAGQDCIVIGAGPAGLMAAFLLARSGLRVSVYEKHPDFMRDFRGDTIHPATLQVMEELGLLEALLDLPHQRATALHAQIGGKQVTLANFGRLPLTCRFIAFMPQWDFLNFLTDQARTFPGFRLRTGCDITGLIIADDCVRGIRGVNAAGNFEARAPLVIAADGRHSIARREAGLLVRDFGSAVDVVWFQLSRNPGDPVPAMSHAGPQQGLVLIDRGDFWQCGYVIRKGDFENLKEQGLDALRSSLAALAPLPADRFEEIRDWSQLHLLQIRLDRLERWWVPGLICIGDAAHAMSPVGGFGVNLAIQDAVAAANILARPLQQGRLTARHLAAVQRRRSFPTKATQALQRMMRRKRGPEARRPAGPPRFIRVIARMPMLAHVMGRLIGMGFRPEHVRDI